MLSKCKDLESKFFDCVLSHFRVYDSQNNTVICQRGYNKIIFLRTNIISIGLTLGLKVRLC